MSGFLLPPLAVICVGALLVCFVFTSTVPAAPAQAQPLSTTGTGSGVPAQGLSPVFTPEVQYWAGRIVTWAAAAGLDPNLAATVMQIESCGDPQARSSAGAMGLFQVMPYHFTASDDPYAPDTNALRGLDYLRRSMAAARGDARLALAGYNGGIGVISWSESAWPLQTQHYAYWGNAIYADASSGAEVSPHLQEWLKANGNYMCIQAHKRLGLNP